MFSEVHYIENFVLLGSYSMRDHEPKIVAIVEFSKPESMFIMMLSYEEISKRLLLIEYQMF